MYKFRKSDGTIVEVTFEQMMQADVAGFLTLPDGTEVRRVRDGRESFRKGSSVPVGGVQPEIVSDTMGCIDSVLAARRKDAAEHGIKVEFRPDPKVPQFYQAVFHSRRDKQRYMEHLHLADRNSVNGSGAMLSEGLLAEAAERVRN